MVLLYCAEQLDGISAAAIITRHATLRKANIKFAGFLNHEKLTQQLLQLPIEPVFIIDICPKEEHLPIIKQKNIIYWSTHDPNSPKTPVKIFDNTKEKKCAAELAKERFLPNDSVAQKLAELGHNMTFWKKSEDSTKLSDIITAGYNPNELIQSMSKGVMWSDQMENYRREYLIRKDQAFNAMLKTLFIKKYLNYNFAYALSSSLLSTADAGQKILDSHKGVDATIVLYKYGRISFRKRNECPINLRKIAQIFDGGGHSYAAGGHMNKTITKQNYETTIQHIDQKLKHHILGTNSNV